MALTSTKPPRCPHCRKRVERMGQKLHPECIDGWVEAQAAKARQRAQARQREAAKVERAQIKKRKEKIKPRSQWESECRAIVQKIARLRDRNDGCISCHLPASWDGQWHGSHYRSHGACSALQFHLWNIHKACWICNKLYSGRIDQYKPRLIEKIGQERHDWLMAQNHVIKEDSNYVEYLKRFRSVMGKRLKRLERKVRLECDA